jgi:hypothetical protein
MISIKARGDFGLTLGVMDTAASIRAQINADALLQAEINRALLAIADNLVSGGDRRVVRILTRTLEASWAEHVSFQHEVIFPILLAHHARRVSEAVDLLRSDHAALSQRQAGVGRLLASMLHGRLGDAAEIYALLRAAFELRRTHLKADAEIERWLPATFNAAEKTLCVGWAVTRPKSRFPLNLLRANGRSLLPPGQRPH